MPVNYNGVIHDSEAIGLDSGNRAFRYGDALFETIRVFEGQMPFWEKHWERLQGGAELLHFQELESASFYKNEIQKLCRMAGNWRIRLTIFRAGGGLYTPQTTQTEFLIEAEALKNSVFALNEAGLKIDICDTIRLPAHPAFNWKTTNSLFYVLAGLYKQDQYLDDCLLLNTKGHIAEASSSNVFVLQGQQLRTPPLRSGCKAGTMRSAIMDLAPQTGLQVVEKKVKKKHLFEADEIWLSNAIRGLQWVGQFREQTYQNTIAKAVVEHLNKILST